MTTDKIVVSGDGGGVKTAMAETERFARYYDLPEDKMLTLRLLSEELLGMVQGIAGRFEGEYWLESEAGEYHLKLRAEADMSREKKKELMSVSYSGKNESTVSIMEMLKHLLAGAQQDPGIDEWSQDPFIDGMAFFCGSAMRSADDLSATGFEWSMMQYLENEGNAEHSDGEKEEEWDRLEKSVIEKYADDVRVGVRGNIIEITIVKRL